MKLIVIKSLIIVPLLLVSSFGTASRIFTSIEEAKTVPADSVFRLDLSKQKLRTIPEEVYTFKNLRELYLAKNKLTELPTNFVFEKLEVLDLTKNDFIIFPTIICQNTNLTKLLMGKNKITALPDCIGQLKNLVILDVWFNPLTELPISLTQLKKLRSLDLRGVNYSFKFQKKWNELLPWVKIEFDLGCDCGY